MKIQTLAVVLAMWIAMSGCAGRNVAIEIPDRYIGWVTLRHSAQDCGRVEKGGWFQSVVEIQASGQGCSTQWKGIGNYALLRYYYVDSSGQRTRELEDTGWGEGGEVWGLVGNADKQLIYFYVGPEASYQSNRTPPR